jgi:Tol biopolymer transport system component
VIDVAVVNGVPTGMNDRILADSADCGFCANPAWSPLGDEIAVDGACGGPGLVVINAFSGAAQVLYTPPAGRIVFGGSAWRSDGLQIAFVEDNDCDSGLPADQVIKVLDLTTNPPTVTRTLLQGQFTDINDLDWARTSNTLAFNTLAFAAATVPNPSSSDFSIYTLDLLPATPVPILRTAGRSPSWSPNDTQLAFEVLGRRNTAGVHILTLATGAITRISGRTFPDWRR